ncbi:unnamed protein product [Cyprideis torosa]|uniref:Calmodulin-lysine N-methyltransferase n=1 Tax=Cyprideis torosa TaxID=163714 RepID=A0A7R8W020_9CRUS|nr:unnamed protein product [Cyprideis torosa]CAG0879294.1 unnamed protein product [Cyprideis torosa]
MSDSRSTKGRWRKAIKLIQTRNEVQEKIVSGTIFHSSIIPGESTWHRITSDLHPDFNVRLSFPVTPPTLEDLHGFNNTGNVRIWMSEEVLTSLALRFLPSIINEDIRPFRVLELGGGMTALGGLALATASNHALEVILSDGNEKSVQNIQRVVSHNNIQCAGISVRRIRWDLAEDFQDLQGNCDLVLCSDCLFFDEGRQPLVSCLAKLLKVPSGVAWIVAPSRNRTLDAFLNMARTSFASVQELPIPTELLQRVERVAVNRDTDVPLWYTLKQPRLL